MVLVTALQYQGYYIFTNTLRIFDIRRLEPRIKTTVANFMYMYGDVTTLDVYQYNKACI